MISVVVCSFAAPRFIHDHHRPLSSSSSLSVRPFVPLGEQQRQYLTTRYVDQRLYVCATRRILGRSTGPTRNNISERRVGAATDRPGIMSSHINNNNGRSMILVMCLRCAGPRRLTVSYAVSASPRLRTAFSGTKE